MRVTQKQIKAGAEAAHAYLEERFPSGGMPGVNQIFADDPLDPKFKHEAGCKELAARVLRAALNA